MGKDYGKVDVHKSCRQIFGSFLTVGRRGFNEILQLGGIYSIGTACMVSCYVCYGLVSEKRFVLIGFSKLRTAND